MNTARTIAPAQLPLFNKDEFLRHGDAPAVEHVVACHPRDLFTDETTFERQLMYDPDALAVLGETIGCDSATLRNQVRTHEIVRMRADLVAIRATDGRPLAVVEIQLDPLDHDHVYRGITYALALNARDLVFIAPGVTDSAHAALHDLRRVLRTTRNPTTLHMLKLHTHVARSSGCGFYELRRESPVTPASPITRKILQAIAAFAVELGDSSLVGLRPDRGQRLEAYRGLRFNVSIRIATTLDSTTLTVHRVDRRTRRRLQRHHFAERMAHAITPAHLLGWRPGLQGSNVHVTYAFPAPLNEDQTIDIDLARAIARYYAELRTQLIRSLGDTTARSWRGSVHRHVQYACTELGMTDSQRVPSCGRSLTRTTAR